MSLVRQAKEAGISSTEIHGTMQALQDDQQVQQVLASASPKVLDTTAAIARKTVKMLFQD